MTLISQLSAHSDHAVQLYCMAVYMQPLKWNKLFVTDFTSNPIITGQYTQNYDFCSKNLKSLDMLFLLDCFPETWNPLAGNYKEFHKQDLCENSSFNEFNCYEVDSKVCFLKVTVKCKLYRGVLEGKLLSSELMINDDSDEGREFYERFFLSVSNSFIIKNNVVLRELVPREFWPRVERALNEVEVDELIRNTQVKRDEEEDILRTDRFNMSELASSPLPLGHDELFLPSSQTHHLSSKGDTTVPKELMLIAPGQSPEPLHYIPLSPPIQGLPNSISAVSSENEPPILSLAQLNQITQVDTTRYYRTNAFIVGTIPDDLSLVCVKSYELDSASLKYKVGDPFLRELEIIICDERTDKLAITLNDSNSLKITLQGEDILPFFNRNLHDYVETFYTKADQYNHLFKTYLMENKRKFMEIKLVRKQLLSEKVDLPVWVSEGLNINSITGEV